MLREYNTYATFLLEVGNMLREYNIYATFVLEVGNMLHNITYMLRSS
jgi:hypothetical protein